VKGRGGTDKDKEKNEKARRKKKSHFSAIGKNKGSLIEPISFAPLSRVKFNAEKVLGIQLKWFLQQQYTPRGLK